MAERSAMLLDMFDGEWKPYNDELKLCIAPTTNAQLAFRAVPTQRTLAEIMQHLVATRIWYFHNTMGEGSTQFDDYNTWDAPDAAPRSASDIVRGLSESWELIQTCFDRWTTGDLEAKFHHEWDGIRYERPRTFYICHTFAHDFAHGGEAALLLGMQGLPAPRM